MNRLHFERDRRFQELLIDTTSVEQMEDVGPVVVLSFFMMMVLEKSKGQYQLDEERFDLGDHMLVFIRPGQVNVIPEAHFEKGFFIFFASEFFEEFLHDTYFLYKYPFYQSPANPPFLRLTRVEFAPLLSLVVEIHGEIQHLQPDSNHLIRSLLYLLLNRINRLYLKQYQLLSSSTNLHIIYFQRLLDQHIRQWHQVQDYAKQLGISRTYLNRLLQDQFGESPQALIRKRLLVEAKKELKFSESPISNIAYELHFPAPSHFIRFFKQMTGLTPQQYRKQLSNW